MFSNTKKWWSNRNKFLFKIFPQYYESGTMYYEVLVSTPGIIRFWSSLNNAYARYGFSPKHEIYESEEQAEAAIVRFRYTLDTKIYNKHFVKTAKVRKYD
jgi:hypothetical protein